MYDIYDKICSLLNNYENDYVSGTFKNTNTMSDSQWLNEFYETLVDVKNDIEIFIMRGGYK